MIDIEWDVPIQMPDYRFDNAALEQMGKVIAADTMKNIRDQKQLDGSALKRNPKGYRDQKMAKGWGGRALVARDRSLIKGTGGKGSSFETIVAADKSFVAVRPANGAPFFRATMVQARGYTGWFGISERAVVAIKEVVRRFIERAHAKAAKKGGRR